ncbi:MAG TPA: histidine kinase [Methylomirabilota bacterium]|nr:histidine kinase [Methylomirabilota bacterium]
MPAAAPLRRLLDAHWFRVLRLAVLGALIMTALVALAGGVDISVTLRSALIHAGVMTALVTASMQRLRRRLVDCRAPKRYTTLVAALAALSVVGTLLADGIITLLALRPFESYWTCVAHDFLVNALITLTLGISMTIYETQRRRLEAVTLALRERELAHERALKMALEARLAALEARLQPHFMFNTLNAISALIEEDPAQAERTVERLAALLRFSLDATERGLVPLGHELKIVTDYLEIERTRFGERLAYTLDVPAEAAACEVPPLAVQTLVENSVKHAIAPRPEGGRIRVDADVGGGRLRVRVWDDGPGFTTAAIRQGHGLDIVQGRLAARFGAAAGLSVEPRDGGTLVTLTLPAG